MKRERQKTNQDKLDALAKTVLDYSAGMTISASIYMGYKLDLYKAMHGQKAMTSAELASQKKLHERFVREWLRGQAAAGLIEYEVENDTYELSSEAALVLADENNPYFQAASFLKILSLPNIVAALETSFKTGVGFSFDVSGENGAEEIEKTFSPWYKSVFLKTALPALSQVEQKLLQGAKVADIGCGAGIALIEMASKFPASQFYGYEISAHSLERADKNKKKAGIHNVTFLDINKSPLKNDNSFDLITLLDSLHDMTHPQEMLNAIQKALKPNGTLFIADMKSENSYAENLKGNPFVKHMYSWSLLYCLPCSLSKPDGMGLGTLGLSPRKLNDMLQKAKLKLYKQHDFNNPLTAYYEILNADHS